MKESRIFSFYCDISSVIRGCCSILCSGVQGNGANLTVSGCKSIASFDKETMVLNTVSRGFIGIYFNDELFSLISHFREINIDCFLMFGFEGDIVNLHIVRGL